MTNTERFLEGLGKDRPFQHSKIFLLQQTWRHRHLPNYYPAELKKNDLKQTAFAFAIFVHVVSKILRAVFGTLPFKYPIFEREIIEQV